MDLDLTDAVEAAARAAATMPAFVGDAVPLDGLTMWDSLTSSAQHLLRELVLPLVVAASPALVDQVDSAHALGECPWAHPHPEDPRPPEMPSNFHG